MSFRLLPSIWPVINFPARSLALYKNVGIG
jgi:hypothetical protein